MIFKAKKGHRTGFLINVDQINREAAIRQGQFKLRVTWNRKPKRTSDKRRQKKRKRRNPYDRIPQGWSKKPNFSVFDKTRRHARSTLEEVSTRRLKRSEMVEMSNLSMEEKERQINTIVEEEDRDELMNSRWVTNDELIELLNNSKKYRTELYDLANDPTERNNIAEQEENITAWLVKMLQHEIKSVLPPGQLHDVQGGNPKYHGGAWMPWE